MKKKIMVVDDNESIIFAVKAGLQDISNEYNVIGVNNGEECIEKAGNIKPDLILLDVMMPKMNGWVVNKKLKMMPETKDIPVIFLTALTDNLSRSMGSVGGDDFIEKPFDIQDVDARINEVLKKSK